MNLSEVFGGFTKRESKGLKIKMTLFDSYKINSTLFI